MSLPHFFTLEDLEALARDTLTPMVLDYYAGGADEEFTVRENRQAFRRYRILPRILVDVSKLDTSLDLLGYKASFPVLVAPMAMQRMAHPDGEIATAKGAAAAGVPMIFSTMATTGLEPMAQTGHPCLIYQLYVIKNRAVVRSWVEDAERLGYKAVMITVDAQRLGRRERDERNKFRLPEGLQLENLKRLRVTQRTQARDDKDGSGLMALFASEVDDSLTWEFLPWLRSITCLPIFIKGLLSAEDAVLALQYGVNGIVVSNHGGRQLDYSPSALDCLPAVVAAVAGRVPVLVDGGIRRGTDILKALALGAQAVLLGRPVLYGLALAGQTGVSGVLTTLKAEFETAMALAGCPSLKHITPDLILPPGALAPPARTCASPKMPGNAGQGSLTRQMCSSNILAKGLVNGPRPEGRMLCSPEPDNSLTSHASRPLSVGPSSAYAEIGSTAEQHRCPCVAGGSCVEAGSAGAVCTTCIAQAASQRTAPALQNGVRVCACKGIADELRQHDQDVLYRTDFYRIGGCSCSCCTGGGKDFGVASSTHCNPPPAAHSTRIQSMQSTTAAVGSAAQSWACKGAHSPAKRPVAHSGRMYDAALLDRGFMSPMGSRL